MKRVLASDIAHYDTVKKLLNQECFFSNDVKAYLDDCRREFMDTVVLFLVPLILLCLELVSEDIDILSCIMLLFVCVNLFLPIKRQIRFYSLIRKHGVVSSFEEARKEKLNDPDNDFFKQRKTKTFYEVLPQPPLVYKIDAGISVFLALGCVVVGGIVLLDRSILSIFDNDSVASLIIRISIGIALIYLGIMDLIDCRRDIRLIKESVKARS